MHRASRKLHIFINYMLKNALKESQYFTNIKMLYMYFHFIIAIKKIHTKTRPTTTECDNNIITS